MLQIALIGFFLLCAVGGLGVASGLSALEDRRTTGLSLALAAVYGLLLVFRPENAWFSNLATNLAVIVGGAAIGLLLSRLLTSVSGVMAFLVTAAVVDLFSFSGGLTNSILEGFRSGGSDLLRWLAAFVELGGREYAVIGVGDLLILTAAYMGFRRATGWKVIPATFLLAGLTTGVCVGIWLGGLPGVPFVAAGGFFFVLFHRRHVRDAPTVLE